MRDGDEPIRRRHEAGKLGVAIQAQRTGSIGIGEPLLYSPPEFWARGELEKQLIAADDVEDEGSARVLVELAQTAALVPQSPPPGPVPGLTGGHGAPRPSCGDGGARAALLPAQGLV